MEYLLGFELFWSLARDFTVVTFSSEEVVIGFLPITVFHTVAAP